MQFQLIEKIVSGLFRLKIFSHDLNSVNASHVN